MVHRNRLPVACISVIYIRGGIIVIMLINRKLINGCFIIDIYLLLQKHVCSLNNYVI